jgi:predicted secreted Zn-dependent protease
MSSSFFPVLTTGVFVIALSCLAGAVSLTRTNTPDTLLAELAQLPGITLDQSSVAGSSAKEIRAELDRLGPKDLNGAPRDAFTEWKISWRWPTGEKGPDFSRTQVDRKIRITVPRWEGAPDDAAALRTQWNEYLVALLQHERTHVALVENRYQEVATKISEAYVANSALTVAEAHRIAGEVLAKIRAADREYDQKTKHGKLEGVRFP